MNDAGHQGVVAATDGPAKEMEELQFTLGEGPCIDTSREGRPVLQPDLVRSGPRRWPAFGPAALEAGIRAIYAFPLQVGVIRVGALDLYRDTPGILGNEQLEEALAFADAAMTILIDLQSQVGAGESMNPHAYDVTDTRPEIHQATGMISAQAAVGLGEALLLLRAHAFSAERPIREVARDVVARLIRFHPVVAGSEDVG